MHGVLQSLNRTLVIALPELGIPNCCKNPGRCLPLGPGLRQQYPSRLVLRQRPLIVTTFGERVALGAQEPNVLLNSVVKSIHHWPSSPCGLGGGGGAGG